MKKITRFKWPVFWALIGIALHVVAVISILGLINNSGTSFFGPGETSVTISKPGDYTLWYETKTHIDGQFMTFPADLSPGITIKVLSLAEGAVVPLLRGGISSTESEGTRRVSVGQLDFKSPGQYQIVITGLTEKRPFHLAEQNSIWLLLRFTVFGIVGMLFLVAALGSGIYALTRLSVSKA